MSSEHRCATAHDSSVVGAQKSAGSPHRGAGQRVSNKQVGPPRGGNKPRARVAHARAPPAALSVALPHRLCSFCGPSCKIRTDAEFYGPRPENASDPMGAAGRARAGAASQRSAAALVRNSLARKGPCRAAAAPPCGGRREPEAAAEAWGCGHIIEMTFSHQPAEARPIPSVSMCSRLDPRATAQDPAGRRFGGFGQPDTTLQVRAPGRKATAAGSGHPLTRHWQVHTLLSGSLNTDLYLSFNANLM
jgi:hypothetical protein